MSLSLVQRSPIDCGVSVCDLETSRMKRPWPALGRSTLGGVWGCIEAKDSRPFTVVYWMLTITWIGAFFYTVKSDHQFIEYSLWVAFLYWSILLCFFSDRMSCRVLRCVVNVLNVHSWAHGNSDDVYDQLYEKLEWVFGQCSKYCMESLLRDFSRENTWIWWLWWD
jgi:hypothetical protein